MRKNRVSFLLLLLLASSLSACRSEVAAPSEAPPTEAAPQARTQPTETPQESAPQNELLASAKTPILDQHKSRVNNLRLAAKALSGHTIAPGDTFSFNATVGVRSAERGYQKAAALIDGKKKNVTGGGVCQIATTLYQAAKGAGCPISERHQHQKEIGYAKLGTDAAVNYGTQDLKFRNASEYPIMLALSVENGSVVAEIYQIMN